MRRYVRRHVNRNSVPENMYVKKMLEGLPNRNVREKECQTICQKRMSQNGKEYQKICQKFLRSANSKDKRNTVYED